MKIKLHNSINNKRVRTNAYSLEGYAQISLPLISLLIVFCIISYISLTSLAVWNAHKMTSYEKEINQKSVTIVDLETKLASINKNITQNLAFERGFVETHQIKYVTTKPLTTASRSNEMEL